MFFNNVARVSDAQVQTVRAFNVWALEQMKYTPDWHKLEQYEWQVLFAPDETQRDHPKYNMINQDGAYISKGFTIERYTMFKQKLGEHTKAIMLESRFATAPALPVKGELFWVRPGVLNALDNYRENGVSFCRKRISIDVPHRWLRYVHGDLTLGAKEHQKVPAWTYIGLPDYFNPLIDNGYNYGLVSRYEPKAIAADPYYAFTQKEYDD